MRVSVCYVLNLPLLFLTPLYPFTHLPIRLPTPETVLLLSPTFLIPFLLILLISSLILPLNPSISSPYYALGSILPTALLSSILITLTEIPQSSNL